VDSQRSAVDEPKPFKTKERGPFRVRKAKCFGRFDERKIKQAMSRRTALGCHGFCKTAKIGRRTSKPWGGYESSKPLPPREEAIADQNLDCSGDRKPADAKPPSQSRFTVDACPRLTPRKILSKPIEELEVERPVESGL
jgi:hypothetical protein